MKTFQKIVAFGQQFATKVEKIQSIWSLKHKDFNYSNSPQKKQVQLRIKELLTS